MISREHGCLYVHIPKTGGTSIERKLGWFEELAIGVQDHRSVVELRDAVSPAEFAAWFKFSFVRNPWARVASWYRNVMEDPHHLREHGLASPCSLGEFLTAHGYSWGLAPQLSWIRDRDGAIRLDFIGRFERLEADFSHVCERLGIDDATLPHLLHAPHARPYSELYDAATRAWVAERYSEEIERFGYRFEA